LTGQLQPPTMRPVVGRWQAVLAALALGGAAVCGAAGAGGVQTFPLLGPYGGAHCDGSGVTAGSEGGFGFVRMHGKGTVRAKIRVTGLSPNTTYYVRFIQGAADCGTTDATFQTSALGRAHLKVSEPSVSTHAYVFIEDGPASQFYVTETYFHAL
jgi:hypothetical protein